MNRRKLNFLLIATSMVLTILTACTARPSVMPTLAPADAPVVAPAVEPTIEPTAAPAPAATVPAGELPADVVAQLDTWLNAQVYSEGGDPKAAAPGLVLLVETPAGRYLKAAGVSSVEDGTPMQVADRLEIGSNTKSFTAVLLLLLHEDGVLSLDDTLSKWLPELAADIPNGDQITLRQLANHTSGIAECCNDIIGAGLADPARLAVDYTPEALVSNAIENHSPDFAPGAGFKYSNTNYVLMGMVAEAATGQPLAELFQQRIFDPLGLQTAVLLAGVPQPGEITSQGYYYAGDTRMNVTGWNASQGWAAGANAMTAEDLAAYARGLAAGKLFKNPESMKQMLTFIQAGATYLAPYGLGVMDFGDGYWGHGGTTPGFESLWYVNPDNGTLVVGLSNAGSYANWNFLNVRNILAGKGPQPIVGEYASPAAGPGGVGFPIDWQWIRTVDSSGVNTFDPVVSLSLRKDGVASARSETCGPVDGTFTASAPDALALDLDASAVTCPAGDPLVELLGLLDTIASWRFENGEMIIVLADGTELGLRNPY